MSTLMRRLRAPGAPGDDVSRSEALLRNHDLIPVEPERRKWTTWSYVAFWLSDGININTFMIVSSAIQAGLAWWQAWIAVWIGYSIVAGFLVLSARPGARYHVGFPVIARASWGPWGSFWPVLNRAVMACIWFGVQTYIGGECVTLVLRSIWPSYATIPNGIAESTGVTTRDFVSFFLFWLIQLPFVLCPPESIRWLFYVKAVVVPICAFAFFGWQVHDANGLGPIIRQKSTLSGSALAWAFVGNLMNCISNFATLIVNIPDFARVARHPNDVVWSQLITVPCTFAVTSFLGIIIASSSAPIWGGESIWNPLDILGHRLDLTPHHSATRAGVFFIAAGFILAQIGVNIAANSLSAGSDLTALLPRYVNIRRGAAICAIVGLCMQPWRLVSSGSRFGDYLGSYSLFLSAIAGVIITDYYVIRRGLLSYRSLYSVNKGTDYRYTYGVNWRGVAAYLCGMAPNLPGFAHVLGADIPLGAQRVYTIAFFVGFLSAGLVYIILHEIFPTQGAVSIRSREWLEPADGDEVNDFGLGAEALARPSAPHRSSSTGSSDYDKKMDLERDGDYAPQTTVQEAKY